MPRARKRFVKETEEDSCNEESTDLGSTSAVGSPNPHNCGDNLGVVKLINPDCTGSD